MARLRTALSALALGVATLSAPAAALADPTPAAPESPAVTPSAPDVGPRADQAAAPGTDTSEQARRAYTVPCVGALLLGRP